MAVCPVLVEVVLIGVVVVLPVDVFVLPVDVVTTPVDVATTFGCSFATESAKKVKWVVVIVMTPLTTVPTPCFSQVLPSWEE